VIENLRRGSLRPIPLKRLAWIAFWIVSMDKPAPWPQWVMRKSSEKEPSFSLLRPWDFSG